ncbi:MAG TPA: hypothetical protein VNI01_10995, partial [Elusimicrobiota bacterium]|nr:hypothetical protein [Elusimicrobiota bacterium]
MRTPRAAALALLLACPARAAGPSHPLEPLSGDEIRQAAALVRAASDFPKGGLFAALVLREPPKAEVLAWKGGAFRREAFAVVLDSERNATYEAVADLAGARLSSWRRVPAAQPGQLESEFLKGPEIVKKDPRWQAAMRRRGIADFDKVHVDLWAPGHIREKELLGPRIFRAVFYYQGDSTYYYARPIEGVSALVDMNARKVISVTDRELVPIAKDDGAFHAAAVGPLRTPPKPLEIVQKLGPSFEVRGNEVRWQNWRFRFALHPREGLVLYQVGYDDHGRLRPILYRASLSEMVVPYGDPDPDWEWRSAFDAGEYGVGQMASPLDRGRDVPENAALFDATIADENGAAQALPQAVALYERDGGMLWKHYNSDQKVNESRRGRELVIGFLTSVGNYDYGLNWVFRQDGSLEFVGELTGIMLAKGVKAENVAELGHEGAHSGHLVAPNVAAPHHQHFFNVRLDFDVDGVSNSAMEMETSPLAGAANPYGNAFTMRETLLPTEKAARRDLDLATQRKWKIVSSSRSALGYPTGYVLVPGDNSVPYALPGSLV